MHMTSLHYNATVKHHCVAQPCRGEGVREKRDHGAVGKGRGRRGEEGGSEVEVE